MVDYLDALLQFLKGRLGNPIGIAILAGATITYGLKILQLGQILRQVQKAKDSRAAELEETVKRQIELNTRARLLELETKFAVSFSEQQTAHPKVEQIIKESIVRPTLAEIIKYNGDMEKLFANIEREKKAKSESSSEALAPSAEAVGCLMAGVLLSLVPLEHREAVVKALLAFVGVGLLVVLIVGLVVNPPAEDDMLKVVGSLLVFTTMVMGIWGFFTRPFVARLKLDRFTVLRPGVVDRLRKNRTLLRFLKHGTSLISVSVMVYPASALMALSGSEQPVEFKFFLSLALGYSLGLVLTLVCRRLSYSQ